MINKKNKKINYSKDCKSLKNYDLSKKFDDYKNVDKKSDLKTQKINLKQNSKDIIDNKTTQKIEPVENITYNKTTQKIEPLNKATQKINIDFANREEIEQKYSEANNSGATTHECTTFSQTANTENVENATSNPSIEELKAKKEAEENEKAHKEEVKSAALLLQASTLLALTAIPFLNVLGPFLVKYYHNDKFPELKKFINDLINFQISFAIYYFIASQVNSFFEFIVIGVWLYQTYQAFTKIFEYNYEHKYPFVFKFFK